MTSPFESLSGPGKALRAESPDAKEFADLLHSGGARLKDAGNNGLSLESRFDLLLVVVHTERRNSVRIISARRAIRHEKAIYAQG